MTENGIDMWLIPRTADSAMNVPSVPYVSSVLYVPLVALIKNVGFADSNRNCSN